ALLLIGCEGDEGAGEPVAGTPDTSVNSPDVAGEPDAAPGVGDAAPGVGDAAAEEVSSGDDTAQISDVTVGEDVVSGPPTEPPPIAETYDTFIGDWEMGPGEEVTKCVVKRLSNEEAIWVTAIHSTLAKGSHHLIVYATDEEEETLEPETCSPFTETLSGQAYPLIISQISEETMAMPPGVAVKFKPHQMIRMEAHFLNYYPEDIVARGDVTFDTIAEEDVWSEANMLFYGMVDFELPPQATTSTPWAFLPVADGIEIFALTGHTHQYGVNVEIEHALGPDDLSFEVYPLDETFQWDESPVLQYDPPLKFNSEDGLRFRCTWENTSDEKVGFGEGANEEMCFLWGYYYPSAGYQICVEAGTLLEEYADLLGGTSVCCPGDAICDLVPGLVEELL
ncbi:MAG: hypothetical protein VX938_13795, partial [Myxococcota bacterium]|nr:hypothetical protein [Myxococcota bacterium]